MPETSQPSRISTSSIFTTWWPLCASWVLMGLEMPIISAFLTRLPNPEVSLAAHGSIVVPLSWIIEAPIIMLLSASTALSKDWPSYVKIRRFMNITSLLLTVLHIFIAFTPLYFLVVRDIIHAPAEVLGPARIDLMVMVPWTWAIAYRRFNQGVLIRFGHSSAIGVGTLLRLVANGVVCGLGFLFSESIPATITAGLAMSAGVLTEAIYTGIRVGPVIGDQLKPTPISESTLEYPQFFRFYLPLALTSAIQLLFTPLGSAAMSRMPESLSSLAVWPVVSSALFIARSGSLALNEVVVSMLDQPGSVKLLKKFAVTIGLSFSSFVIIIGITSLAPIWFGGIMGLEADMAERARVAFLLGLPTVGIVGMISWYQGILLVARKTTGIPESVVISLTATTLIFIAGILDASYDGVFVTVMALTGGFAAQSAWLFFRSRRILPIYVARDQAPSSPSLSG